MDKALDPQHLAWLEARGISEAQAEQSGLHTTVQSFPNGEGWAKAKAVSIPYIRRGQVINHKHRRVGVKQHIMDKGAELCLWNHDCLLEKSNKPVVITEGEWDAITALQFGWRAVSVPNGSPAKPSDDPANSKRYECLWTARDHLAAVKKFIIATDGDDAGMALRADLIALLGPAKCSFIEYPEGTKDLNEVLLTYGPEEVSICLHNAKDVPVSGLHKLDDFPDTPELPMHDTGICGLEGAFGLVPATFTVVSGYAGQGKSSLTMKMAANLMASGVNITISSFETLPKPILEKRLMAALVECGENDPSMWRGERGSAARDILANRLTVIANTPDEEHELDLEALVELMETAVNRHESKLVIIDPFNEVEHKRGRDETETEYIGRFIRTIKRFCHRTGCAVWLVAHPRKPHGDGFPKAPSLYDLAGSANFANKADYGLIVYRPDIQGSEIDVSITKVRMGLPGKPWRVTLRFEAAMSRYVLVEG